MSIVLTAPERLSIMLIDASTQVKDAFEYTQKDLDTAIRPCWVIKIDEATFPGIAENTVDFEETYVMDYVGPKFDQGEGHVYEIQARTIWMNTFTYFFSHKQLQFSNNRGLEPTQLTQLSGVKFARISRRSPITIMTGDGIAEPFWGFTMSLVVTGSVKIDEVLVPRIA